MSREYEVLMRLKGKPHIIQLLDFFYTIDHKQRTIQNSVLEFCEGNLEDILKECDEKQEYLELDIVKRIIKESLDGLAHMHKEGVVHRDLKPENILLKEGSVRICDLGSSKVLDTKTFMNTPYVVSRYYRAPELLLGSNLYGSSIDIWCKIALLTFWQLLDAFFSSY